MKTFLVNLLILLSLALCGFNAYQWYREAQLRARVDTLARELQDKSTALQELQRSFELHTDEIRRLEGIRESLTAALQSNRVQVVQLEQASADLRREAQADATRAGQLEQYREALDKANENLRKQNEIILERNEKLKELAADRNEIVGRFNKLAADYKTLGDDYTKVLGLYTNLVARVKSENERNSR